MFGLLTSLAWGAPYYETIELRAIGATSTDPARRVELARELRKRDLALTVKDEAGDERPVRASSIRLWPGTAAFVLMTLEHAAPGAEVDAVLRVREDGALDLLTVLWEADRLVVLQGRAENVGREDGPSAEALTERYGVGPLVETPDRPWSPLVRAILRDALERLTPSERAVLAGLPYLRVAAPAPSDAHTDEDGTDLRCAAFLSGPEGARVELYDRALQPYASFRGTPTTPESVSSSVLLHELGHAIAHLRSSTAVEAWLAATGGDTPTRYGQTSPDEGFAEAFMLHRLDPAALERAAPRSFAWFEATDLGALALRAEGVR